MDIFRPVEIISNFITLSLFRLDPGTYIGQTLNFFIYDIIKIGILLVVINFVMAIVRYYFPMEKTRDILSARRWYGLNYLLAALLGVVTPFCSCSSIPLFMGFLSAGIPLGVTFSFLISSPLVNEASLYLFPAVFGMRLTLLYNLFGIVISVAGGIIIEKLKMDSFIKKEFLSVSSKKVLQVKFKGEKIPLKEKLDLWMWETKQLTRKIFPYLLIGVGLGSLIHGFLPQDLLAKYLSANSLWSVPLAVFLGAPLYANSVAVIPVMEALVEKGIPLGTALAFMTATVTLSIPEALIISKILKKELIITFFGITISGIILMGYLFNWI